MSRFLLLLTSLVISSPAIAGDETLIHARRAQALLGPEIWSTVIAIENETRNGRYPRSLHALVFELAGVLWLYTSIDGTQSFSLHVGNLEEEKSDFGPLLRDIEPGFRRWQPVAGPPEAATELARAGALPNGCFVESVVAWRERVLAGDAVSEPRLLSYYIETARGIVGHTVLTFTADGALEVVDVTGRRAKRLPAAYGRDAARVAKVMSGTEVARARWLLLGTPDAVNPVTGQFASRPAPARPDEKSRVACNAAASSELAKSPST